MLGSAPDHLVFDLNEFMDISEVPLKVYECCGDCQSIVRLHLGDSAPAECHVCGSKMQLAADVALVIRGDTVLYRRDNDLQT
jgi:predicted nucleic acid-binding Zn ribbon protein